MRVALRKSRDPITEMRWPTGERTFARNESSPGIPALAAFDQALIKIPLGRARRPGASCRDSFRFDLSVSLHHSLRDRARLADALRPKKHLRRALQVDCVQTCFLYGIADDVGSMPLHHQREILAHCPGRSFTVFVIRPVKPWTHRHSLAELDRMLMDRHNSLPGGDQRNRHRRVTVNHGAGLRTLSVQRGKEKDFCWRIPASGNLFSIKIVLEDFVFRKIRIEGWAHRHDEKTIASRRAAADVSPHIRQFPAK